MLTHEQFTRLAEKYIDTVFRVAFSCLRSPTEAEDIVQNVFMKLLSSDKSFESEEHIKHWLIRVAVNECKRHLRSPWRRMEPLEDYAASLPFTEPGHSELFLAVMALPQKYRVPIFLYYYEDYSTEEIASMLGRPRATVCTQLARARELLRKTLREDDEK